MAPPNSRDLVRDLFALKELPRIPFIPWVCTFAARLEQVPVKTLLSDAGILSRSLINAQRLFGYDAIVNIFDPSLEAEACGCRLDWSSELPQVVSHPLSEGASLESLDMAGITKRGRLPAVLEATKRLKVIKGKEAAVIGYITGPLTLARHLAGEDFLNAFGQGSDDAVKIAAAAGSAGLQLCRAYCELGVDAVVIADEMLGRTGPDHYKSLAAPFRSIWNVARFFNVHSIILSRGCSEQQIEPIIGLQADGVSLSGDLDYAHVRDAARKKNCCYSRSIESYLPPETAGESGSHQIPHGEKGRGFFLSTEWEVPSATGVNRMHEIMRIVKSV